MNRYEQLLSSTNENIIVIEKQFKSKAKGLCKGNKIGISKDIETTTEKACVLAEELGHYYTTVGDIIDMTDTQNRKQERQARLWAYNKLVGLRGLVAAYEHGCKDKYEIAEFCNVTDEYLHNMIECYRDRYGVCTTVDNYLIIFIPNLTIGKIV